MRQPPNIVPTPIVAVHAMITHTGTALASIASRPDAINKI